MMGFWSAALLGMKCSQPASAVMAATTAVSLPSLNVTRSACAAARFTVAVLSLELSGFWTLHWATR